MGAMDVEFEGPVVEWRGPAPYFFVQIPQEESADIKEAARGVEYWGQVPVVAAIRGVEFGTALFPQGEVYLLPLKVSVRREAGLDVEALVENGESLEVGLRVGRE